MVKMCCQGPGCIQIIIMETYIQDVLPRPRVYTDHHGDMVKTFCQGYVQIIFVETHTVTTCCQDQGYVVPYVRAR